MLKRLAFERDRDLARLLDLVATARLARGSDFLHPGGLEWLLRRLVNPNFEVSLWLCARCVISAGVGLACERRS